MIFKREFTSHNATVIESEFGILTGLFLYIDIFRVLPNKEMQIVFVLALIFIAWLFIKQLIFFRIRLKESDLKDEEKQKGFILSIVYISIIILLTIAQIIGGLRS